MKIVGVNLNLGGINKLSEGAGSGTYQKIDVVVVGRGGPLEPRAGHGESSDNGILLVERKGGLGSLRPIDGERLNAVVSGSTSVSVPVNRDRGGNFVASLIVLRRLNSSNISECVKVRLNPDSLVLRTTRKVYPCAQTCDSRPSWSNS